MDKKPMEEELEERWKLITSDVIISKIFEGDSNGKTLSDIMSGEILVACSYSLGKILSPSGVNLKAAQLRKFYTSLLILGVEVNALKSNEKDLEETSFLRDILALKPKLAYSSSRQKEQFSPFFTVINPLLDIVRSKKDYNVLCTFVESVIAYHKYCDGSGY